ncbi:sigma-70 family RNA polymerase sigma factor [Streptomyces sp. NPDC001435]|uniref:sigma-70 family RNA polymerase sigma factor n=1 Tax=Streptomyces sp. NPDC001435 TaxID=3364576 RepID=UPI00367DD216
MRYQAVGVHGAPVTRAALAELLVQLRRAAVDGIVPESAFAAQVQKLGLGDAERERLRAELARLGVPVQESVVHTDTDSPDVEKVARIRGENVFPRVERVRGLLTRYLDADGYVTPQVVDGVIRLAGLTGREAAQLQAEVRVRHVDTAEERPAPAEPSPVRDVADGGASEQDAVPRADDFATAVAAALSVLGVDRVQRRPESRLLGAEAEVGLAVLLRGGADHVGQEPTDTELSALPSGDIRIRARDCLVLHNLRLVHSLVRPYLEQGLDYDDLVQHGALGLMRAARKFDPTMGNKFSTYATWWVRQSITRAIADEGALIRIPVHMHEQMRKVAAAERALAAQGRAAGAADVAVHCDMSVRKVEEVRKLSRRTDSLDRVISDGATLGDLLGEVNALPSVEHGVLNMLLMDDVMAVVGTFDERSARVLVRRLGLDGDEPSTLDELGREFSVTRERIRQVESKTLPVFRQRLRTAGLVSAFRASDGQGADEDGGQGRPMKRRARGKAPGTAVVAEPRPAAERESRKEALPLPVPDQEPSSRTEEETAVVESGEHEGEQVLDAPGARTPAVPAQLSDALSQPGVVVQSPPPVAEPGMPRSVRYTADWDKALRLAATFEGGIDWLAEYALLALGHSQLTVILGPAAATAVVGAVRERATPDQQVLAALEVLQRVFDILRKAGYRPEDFFERPAEALVGVTPRTYLARKPLVNTESRLALRDALREFAAEMPSRKPAAPSSTEPAEDAHGRSVSVRPPDDDRVTEPAAASDDARSAVPVPGPATDEEGQPVQIEEDTEEKPAPQRAAFEEELARLRAEADLHLAEVRRDHDVRIARMRDEHERRLTEERQAADARVAAASAESARQLDVLEEALLRRVDTSLMRRERSVRAQYDEHLTRLREEHRALLQEAVRRAEHAEERAQYADFYRQRAGEADRRLREYRENTEARIADLEARLRQAESVLAERDHALQAARQQAQAAEQRAAQHVAQTERNAWARINELQEQLAAERAGGDPRTSLRERWRRS